jgi:hypothetical protein
MQVRFVMRFVAKILPVALEPEKIPALLVKVRAIYDLPVAPDGRENCKDCVLLNKLVGVIAQ